MLFGNVSYLTSTSASSRVCVRLQRLPLGDFPNLSKSFRSFCLLCLEGLWRISNDRGLQLLVWNGPGSSKTFNAIFTGGRAAHVECTTCIEKKALISAQQCHLFHDIPVLTKTCFVKKPLYVFVMNTNYPIDINWSRLHLQWWWRKVGNCLDSLDIDRVQSMGTRSFVTCSVSGHRPAGPLFYMLVEQVFACGREYLVEYRISWNIMSQPTWKTPTFDNSVIAGDCWTAFKQPELTWDRQ